MPNGGGPIQYLAGFAPSRLTNPQGFTGVEGYFRLRTDGQVDRALAVYEITPSGARMIEPPVTTPTN